MLFSTVFVSSLVASVTAHATFQELWINGVDQGSSCVRLPQSNSPVTSVTSDVSIPLSSPFVCTEILGLVAPFRTSHAT